MIGNVPKATQAEMDAAANAAAKAFPKWSNTSILARQQIMFKFQSLIKDNMVRCNYAKFERDQYKNFLVSFENAPLLYQFYKTMVFCL